MLAVVSVNWLISGNLYLCGHSLPGMLAGHANKIWSTYHLDWDLIMHKNNGTKLCLDTESVFRAQTIKPDPEIERFPDSDEFYELQLVHERPFMYLCCNYFI